MAERCINLDAHEALAAAEGRLRVILRPVRFQPDREIHGEPYWNIGGYRARPWTHPTDDFQPRRPLTCPYGSPGDVVVGREAWFLKHHGPDEYPSLIYRADGEARHTDGCSTSLPIRSPGPWRSAATMPAALARHRWTLESVEVVRVAQISKEDAIGAGATRREWPKEHPSESGYGWSMGWLRVGELSQYAGGIYARNDKRPLKERHVCLGSPRTAVGNWWNSRWGKKHPWETAWAWKLGVMA